jgi:hypothetical protein
LRAFPGELVEHEVEEAEPEEHEVEQSAGLYGRTRRT